jgi:hypothetical protein
MDQVHGELPASRPKFYRFKVGRTQDGLRQWMSKLPHAKIRVGLQECGSKFELRKVDSKLDEPKLERGSWTQG